MKVYCIDTDKIIETIREEVSRVAALAYTEEKVSMYDVINITSKDYNVIDGLIADAKNKLVSRFSDVAVMHDDTIVFYIPETRTHPMCVIAPALDRYIALDVCAAWFLQREKMKVEEYTARAAEALSVAERLVYEKLPPVAPTHIEN